MSTTAFALCDAELELLSRQCGAQVTPASRAKPCAIRADFDGDGTPDTAMLVRLVAEPSALPAAIVRLNPLRRSAGGWTGQEGGLAIAISLGGATAAKLFLLADAEFFSTPVWRNPDQLLSKMPKSKAPRAAKGDALGVATESGADMLVYWTGTAWRAEASPEEP